MDSDPTTVSWPAMRTEDRLYLATCSAKRSTEFFVEQDPETQCIYSGRDGVEHFAVTVEYEAAFTVDFDDELELVACDLLVHPRFWIRSDAVERPMLPAEPKGVCLRENPGENISISSSSIRVFVPSVSEGAVLVSLYGHDPAPDWQWVRVSRYFAVALHSGALIATYMVFNFDQPELLPTGVFALIES